MASADSRTYTFAVISARLLTLMLMARASAQFPVTIAGYTDARSHRGLSGPRARGQVADLLQGRLAYELVGLGVVALEVMADAFLDSERERIVELSARNRIAGCYPWARVCGGGCMMSYGTNLADSYRQAAIYAGRIIKGESPEDLPVMQPTKFELVLNLKTTATLGIAVPPDLLAIADEVIE